MLAWSGRRGAVCFSIQVTTRNLGRGAPRGAPGAPAGVSTAGAGTRRCVGSGASWDNGVVLVCAGCSRRGGAARTGLGVRARRQYKQSGGVR